MRIVVVGASGTLGKAVVGELGARHTIVPVSRQSAGTRIDITDPASIEQGLAALGGFDALVCTAGKVKFAPLSALDDAGYRIGLGDKLMGQVNLVMKAIPLIAPGGSFTLIGGILAHDPIVAGSSASMVNGALESFVKAAAIELPKGLRINLVSPGLLVESLSAYGAFFPGHEPVPAARAARAFAKSVEGAQTGQIYPVF